VANVAKNTPPGGGRSPRAAYDQTVGDLVGNLLGRKRKSKSANGRVRGETFRFVAYLDRIPPHILEDDGFRQRHSAAQEVECEIEADDFAAAVAEAIRALEEDEFTHVQAIERLSL
jgi:hypothetical protein